MPTILAYENGPFVLKGRARYRTEDRTTRESAGEAVALCRCGRTAAGPFCDGTHGEVGFRAAGYELTVDLPVKGEERTKGT